MNVNLKIDLSESGLRLVFKPYQEVAMKYLWSLGDRYASTLDVYAHVNKQLEEGISRASIINFLDKMQGNGFLTYITRTGKGGKRRLYRPIYDQQEFWEVVKQRVEEKIAEAIEEAKEPPTMGKT